MTTTPPTNATSRFETLFEQLNDPVVEFKLDDGEPIIVQANAAFREVFCVVDSVAGLPLNDLIVPADRQGEATDFDERTADGKPNRAVIERTTADGTRKFLYRSVPIGENHGFAIYSDITAKLRQERYLDVLQRVLRHNLRNDVNLITGHAEQALETAENEATRDALESITETADSLTQLCTEAQTIRNVLGESATLEPTALTPIVDSVSKDCLRRFQQATITVDCPDDLTVQADGRLRIVVDSLVDNAIRHNTSSMPKVTVAASVDDDTVELTVRDNGPGIPETERDIVLGDAEISPLSHGSGLGLWLVKWLTESYGGRLDIAADDGGSVVRVQLKRVPA
ncbi:HAMP domain-containing histidine kinase [Halonotius terrestris]|uniref:histidine kinase n=1 Tax=Halonotius terrestris TaxID=2487750 RepID=A0A8J8TDG3_9EURY|nr:HAMP domain-containing sensor histidine kinase [Halonotius terrestris]TQQ83501.1 HAMP domain-containing histidine kinase [Halonotius terrestris]